MYQLPPLPKQVQKPVAKATPPLRQAPKKPPLPQDAPAKLADKPQALKKDNANKSELKVNEASNAAKNADVKENDGVNEFADLVSDVEAIDVETVESVIDVSVETEETVVVGITASELASAKLSEFNLNTVLNTGNEAEIAVAATKTDGESDVPSQVKATPAVDALPTEQKLVIENAPQAKVSASNDNIAVEAVAPEIKSESAGSRTENYLSGLIERLENLTAEVLDKAGIKPEQMTKIVDHVENMLEMAEAGETDLDIAKLIKRLTSIFTNDGNGNANGTEVRSPAEKLIEATALNPVAAEATGHARKIVGMKQESHNGVSNNDVQDENFERAKLQDKQLPRADAKPTEAASQQNQAANNQHVQVEASKYANRYNKTNSQDNFVATSGDDASTSTETVSASKLTAAYNNVKSSVMPSKTATQAMSALDKISQKNPMDFLTQMQNSVANQATNPQNQENVVNVKLAMQNGRLPQNLPLNSMAFQIGKQFSKGNSEFQIRLDPAELGRINIKLSLKQGGNVKAHMVVERNDVFELLQRDARALEKALGDAGFEGKDVDVEFSLDQNANNGGTFAENFFNQDNDGQNGRNNANGDEVAQDEVEEMVATHMPLHVKSTGIDRTI